MAKTTYTPEWKKFEEDMRSDDPQKAMEATEKFTAAREHELKTNSQAKRWEESRKQSWAKDKPQWARERVKNENNPIEKFRKDMKELGVFDTGVRPSPGYLIVDLGEKKSEEKLDSGIYIPTAVADDALKNTGIVLDVGDELVIESPNKVPQPCQSGDKILFKKGAGVDIEVNGHICRFMVFSDVLGTFYE